MVAIKQRKSRIRVFVSGVSTMVSVMAPIGAYLWQSHNFHYPPGTKALGALQDFLRRNPRLA
jgi:hypothetical protein